ncbi:MAG: antibiotic biosynthesis monooxygenase [Bacillota bacterium]
MIKLARFRIQFKELQPLRKEYGLTDIDLFLTADEPNTIIIMIEYENLERAKAYWNSKGLAEAREKAGVLHHSEQVWYTGGYVE